MRIYSYTRVSTGVQTTGSGLDRQLQAARAYAESVGGVLDEELALSDRGRSAYKGKHLQGALGEFLRLAQAGALGTTPHLVVEDIDRLSRLEPLDGLQDVLLTLIRAGVSIHTTIDGATYSRDRLRTDASALLVLVVKIQAAHDYSLRLSARVKGGHAHKRAAIAKGERPKIGPTPAWIDYVDGTYKLNANATVVARMYELSERGWGGTRIARTLNEEGIPTPRGRMWSAMSVNATMSGPQVYGALQHCTGEEDQDGKPKYAIKEGFYPPVVSWAQYEAAAHRRATSTGRRGAFQQAKSFLWVGQGLTRCALCGAACGINSGSTRDGGRLQYLRCRTPGCKPGGWPLAKAQAYLLDRMTDKALAMLTATPVDTAALDLQVSRAGVELDAARQRLANAEAKVMEAATADVSLSVVVALDRAIDDARKATEQARVEHGELVAQRQALMASAPLPSAGGLDLSTPADRQTFNDALQRWGLRIEVDKPANQWGLGLPGRELVWARFGDDWWLDFGWVGATDEPPPPEWTPTAEEQSDLEHQRQDPAG